MLDLWSSGAPAIFLQELCWSFLFCLSFFLRCVWVQRNPERHEAGGAGGTLPVDRLRQLGLQEQPHPPAGRSRSGSHHHPAQEGLHQRWVLHHSASVKRFFCSQRAPGQSLDSIGIFLDRQLVLFFRRKSFICTDVSSHYLQEQITSVFYNIKCLLMQEFWKVLIQQTGSSGVLRSLDLKSYFVSFFLIRCLL